MIFKVVQVVKWILVEVIFVDVILVMLKLFNGQSEIVFVSGVVKVIKFGFILMMLNSFIVGDCVEMIKDMDNFICFRVMIIMSKQFWFYDGVGN